MQRLRLPCGLPDQVLAFIEEEAAATGPSQGDLQRQEEQRSRLSRARQNLKTGPKADTGSAPAGAAGTKAGLEGVWPWALDPRGSSDQISQAVRAVRRAGRGLHQPVEQQGPVANEVRPQKLDHGS